MKSNYKLTNILLELEAAGLPEPYTFAWYSPDSFYIKYVSKSKIKYLFELDEDAYTVIDCADDSKKLIIGESRFPEAIEKLKELMA